MPPAPLISIVIPVFNDEATIAAAVTSCLRQTVSDIEVICVDDASTDATVEVIEQLQAMDPRVRLLRHDRNRSAFQSRRTGIMAAGADFVLFVDGDDELEPRAGHTALARAHETSADLVGFGVTVVDGRGNTGGSYEQRLQLALPLLEGAEILSGLFPVNEPARGQLWRFLFRTSLLRDAYALLPDDLALARVNDLPLMFLVAALATRYASVPEKLYRYHLGRGGSGHRVDSVERAQFYSGAISSINSIHGAVVILESTHADAVLLRESYESARRWIIGYVCFQLIERSDPAILDGALEHLRTLASTHDIIHAAAQFYPRTLTTLKFHTAWQGIGDRPVKSVMLVTAKLLTGGVSAVIAAQAQHLRGAGYRVTVVARSAGSDRHAIPEGVTFVEMADGDLMAQLAQWAEICRTHAIDVVIDHQVLYMRHWAEFALMARAEGAATIGWMHNFVGRPIYDGNERLSLIERCSNTLAHLVVLSPLDVAYFKMRGVAHTSFAPNPPSPLLLESLSRPVTKAPPTDRVELIWLGRLEQNTKQVSALIDVAVELRRLSVDFHITVVGPDWADLTAKKFNAEARRRRVGDNVVAVGPLRGPRLIDAVDAADAFISTSIIEGYQLTIPEAQARGLPVFMYELPWLSVVQDNPGIVTAPQGEARILAKKIADLLIDPERYARLSDASIIAAERARDYDFARLYRGLVTGVSQPEFSPAPTLDDAGQLLGLMVFFAERSHRRGSVRSSDESLLRARAWRSAAPVGRAILQRIPGLRPLAHRAKTWLRAH